ncbi:MAG: M23 family metallopeptidase [Spirochaetaceae bacterium]|nr:MAG: M23 family metallopeptidase [Spirochaetaceae bacterium]
MKSRNRKRTRSDSSQQNSERPRGSATVGDRLRSGFAGLRSRIALFYHAGRQRFTVMFIPHSERRVVNVQLNWFALGLLAVMTVGLVAGFFYLASRFTGSDRVARISDARLREAEAGLDIVRQEVGEFLQVYDEFERVLATTLRRLDADRNGGQEVPTSGGDLAALLNLDVVTAGQVREIAELRRIVASLRGSVGPLTEIGGVLQAHQQLLSDIPNKWPVGNGLGYVTMEFGPNINPITGVWHMHRGVNISYYPGTPVVAAASGVVSTIGVDVAGGTGAFVQIDHKYGFRTRYASLGRVAVREGQHVIQGQRIGAMGNNAVSIGPHLTFSIWIGTELIDPSHFLKLARPDYTLRGRARS